MDELIQFINMSGFPVAVAAYCLIRMETTIKQMTDALTKLTVKIGGMDDE